MTRTAKDFYQFSFQNLAESFLPPPLSFFHFLRYIARFKNHLKSPTIEQPKTNTQTHFEKVKNDPAGSALAGLTGSVIRCLYYLFNVWPFRTI